ncbi:MAG: DNA recombination protein RmuC [Candidatus Izemoplasmatales bacterium]|nr:DNA recombination protein RmuC [Candidatus Izemoplasmatales bacterium]
MTDFERALLIIVLILILSILIINLISFFTMRKKENDNLDLKNELNQLQIAISNYLNDGLSKISISVNDQLIKSLNISNDNISGLKDKLYTTISDFQEKLNERFNLEFKELTESIDKRMHNINEKVEERLDKGFRDANTTFVNIAKRVEVIDEAQKNILSLSEEMVSLKNILSNNQARGSYGEYQLNQLLYSIFGHNNRLYQTQYTMKEGKEVVRADAVVFMPEPNGMIAIDSKFPYSAYSKLFDNKNLTKDEEQKLISQFGLEVKKHITDISKKYINPPQTTDYALMFVPSDGILALLHSQLQNVVEYARDKFVTIVSPTTIIPLLSSFKAFIIDSERNKYTKLITDELIKLSREFKRFSDEWGRLSRAIDSVKKNSDSVNFRVEKISSKFSDIKNVGIEQGLSTDDLNNDEEE